MISSLTPKQLRNFTLATVANFFFFCNFSSFFLLPLYIESLGGDEAKIGFIMGSFGITSLGAIPFVAYLLDRYGRKKFMLLGAAIMFVASISYSRLSALGDLFYVYRLLQGVGFALFFTSAGTFVSDYVPANRRAQGLGIFGAFTIAAYAIGPSLGEVILLSLGFKVFFIFSSGFSLIALVLVLFTEDGEFELSSDRFGFDFFRLVVSKRYAALLATNLIIAGGLGSILNFVAPYLRSKGIVAFSFFLTYTIVVTSIRILGGRLSDRIGRRAIALPSILVVGISLILMMLVDSVLTAVLISFLFSFGYGLLYPVFSAMVIDKARPDERGKAMGAFNASFSMGINFLAFPLGVIARDYGYDTMYVVTGVVVLCGFVFFMLLEPE